MIPRFSPWLRAGEVRALFGSGEGAVGRFEAGFAAQFGCTHGLAFPYGRSALWAFLCALGFRDREVVMPAYTCTVVAHGVVLSGNVPRFVDIQLDDYNMDLAATAEAINEKTCAVVATHIFGYPLDQTRLEEIVRAAEKEFGHKIWIVQDCAHSFGAERAGGLVTAAPDLALFGLNISKIMTSVFGGMLTSNDEALMTKLRSWRDEHYEKPAKMKSCKRAVYMVLASLAFRPLMYGLVHCLQTSTPLLKGLTDSYHLDDEIHFPPDHLDLMTPLEGRVGMVQLAKYEENIRRRRANAAYYDAKFADRNDWVLPPALPGATYSHYSIRVPNRDELVERLAGAGVELGKLIDYSVPSYPSYHKYTGGASFPNSELCSRSMINLPVHPALSAEQRDLVVKGVLAA